jgi:hypothetical protein
MSQYLLPFLSHFPNLAETVFQKPHNLFRVEYPSYMDNGISVAQISLAKSGDAPGTV